jgi:hypothetical protein
MKEMYFDQREKIKKKLANRMKGKKKLWIA